MSFLRRILGIFVMLAGTIGLLLSLGGIAGVWMAKPVLLTSLDSTITTLENSIQVSQDTMVITDQALGATVASVDALSEMLSTTALTVNDTQPVLIQVTGLMSVTLPATFDAATSSLDAASQAAVSLEGAIKSFETFQAIIAATPLLGAIIPANTAIYNPEKPLAESLAELSVTLENMPATFTTMSADLDKADDNLVMIKGNLETMSVSVASISTSLEQYQSMIGASQTSMESLKTTLDGLRANLEQTINTAALVLTLFLVWLFAAQVVIFSQGLELFHGTATRMEAPAPKEEKPAE